QLDVFELEHPLQIMRLRHEEVRRQHLLDDGADTRQREVRLSTPTTFHLEKAVGEGGQDDVSLPPRQTAAFEVVEADLVLELLILLLDRPSLMGETDDRAQRGGRG